MGSFRDVNQGDLYVHIESLWVDFTVISQLEFEIVKASIVDCHWSDHRDRHTIIRCQVNIKQVVHISLA